MDAADTETIDAATVLLQPPARPEVAAQSSSDSSSSSNINNNIVSPFSRPTSLQCEPSAVDLPPPAVGAAHVNVSPSHKTKLVFASIEDLRDEVDRAEIPVPPPRRAWSNRPTSAAAHVSQLRRAPSPPVVNNNDIKVDNPPPYSDAKPESHQLSPLSISTGKLFASEPNLLADRPSTKASAADVQTLSPLSTKSRSIFSFFAQHTSEEKPVRKKMKTVRVLKKAKVPPSKTDAMPAPTVQGPVPAKRSPPQQPEQLATPIGGIHMSNGVSDAESPNEENSAKLNYGMSLRTEPIEEWLPQVAVEVVPEALGSAQEDTVDSVVVSAKHASAVGPSIIHLHDDQHTKQIRSPNVVKTVRFVTPEVSDNDNEDVDTADHGDGDLKIVLPKPEPLKRTVLPDAADAADPWAVLAQHRRDTEALDRNRQVAAMRVLATAERAPTHQSDADVRNRTDDAAAAGSLVLTLTSSRPRTLREMQRELRERRENRAELSDTEA